MITIRSQTLDLHRNWNRRDLLRIGFSLAGSGPLAFANRWVRSADANVVDTSFGRAKSCIFIYLYGGPSHLDIWDMKPHAPAEIRGEFRPIQTKVPDLHICEHLPHLAARADRLAIIRSLTHDSRAHGSAGHRMLTGHSSSKQGEIAPTTKDFPHLGSVVAQQFGPQRETPPFVSLPWQITTQINTIPGQGSGFLKSDFDPLRIQYDDEEGSKFAIPSPAKLQSALAIERESDQTRERYGRNVFGQSLLLARRLVEAGVRVVTVYWPDRKDEKALFYNGKRQPVSVPMWDTHGTHVGDTANFSSLKNRLLPPLDMASSALLDDLSAAGKLDETLVVWTGEFGRTPQVQGDGRGHYCKCFSSMLAGGGVRGGLIYGASDATASTPTDLPVAPADFFATIYHALGISKDTQLIGPEGQPHPLTIGNVCAGLLA